MLKGQSGNTLVTLTKSQQDFLIGFRIIAENKLHDSQNILVLVLNQVFDKTPSLTVVRPAGVEHMLSIRGEADIQHAPSYVSSLHCPS